MNDQLISIKVVEHVENHDLLYNYNLLGYSKKDLTENNTYLRVINMFSSTETHTLIFVFILC